MNIETLNALPEEELRTQLSHCCGSTYWVNGMIQERPFTSVQDLHLQADKIWATSTEADWLEAFTHHPKIGDIGSLRLKFAATATWASGEQQGVQQASDAVLTALAEGNDLYETKFGFIFIVCATGKSAAEMLELLQARLPNSRSQEIAIARDEQHKITHIRLDKLMV